MVGALSVLTAALSAAGGATGSGGPGAASVGYALVVSNNRSLSPEQPDLQYADDDGGRYAQLFAERLGADHVVLLTDFDAPSRALFPTWSELARPPTRANLEAAVSQLSAAVGAERDRGRVTDLFLVFAGHGDLARGEAYFELADSRLYASDLDTGVLARLAADRVHLILDSCNSYFMLSPRKPGAKRWAAPQEAPSLLDKYPQLGAIVSTSAEAVTYEWSELQSGIFSYELRSGLRGAADANADGEVTYAELAAFVRVANDAVVNDLYRPKVFAQGPHRDVSAPLWLVGEGRTLIVGPSGKRRLTLRNAQGVRLVDLHKEEGTAIRLALPPADTIAVYETVNGGVRPSVELRELAGVGTVDLDSQAIATPTIASRGEARPFAALFARPFGARAFAETQAALARDPPFFGVSRRDAEQLQLHLAMAVELGRDLSLGTASSALNIALIGAGIITPVVRSDRLTSEQRTLVVGPLAFAGAGGLLSLVGLAVGPPGASLLSKLAGADMSTEAKRSAAVLELRREFQHEAERVARWRKGFGLVGLGVGLTLAGRGAWSATRDARRHRSLTDSTCLELGDGLALLFTGALQLLGRTPLERTWSLYEQSQESPLAERQEEEAAVVLLTLAPSAKELVFGFGVQFRTPIILNVP